MSDTGGEAATSSTSQADTSTAATTAGALNQAGDTAHQTGNQMAAEAADLHRQGHNLMSHEGMQARANELLAQAARRSETSQIRLGMGAALKQFAAGISTRWGRAS